MAEAKNTHVAVHAIQYRDKDKQAVEIKPGTEFAPGALGLDAVDLAKKGAIRKLAVKKAAAEADAGKGGDVPAK